MPPAARVTDLHTCPMTTGPVPHVGGPIIPPAAPTVLINFLPAATVTTPAVCVGPPDVIVKGSAGVFINFLPAARMGDQTAHGGVIVSGSPNVLIGEIGSPSPGAAGMGGIVAGLVQTGLPDAAGGKNASRYGHGPSNPCAGHGLATTANEKQFAHDMKKLQKDWPKLSADQRTHEMETIVNKQLSKSGAPPVGVAPVNTLSASTNGQMNFSKWNLDMNPALMSSPDLSNEQTAQLGNTLYHETRHGEQWYLIARSEAGQGKNPQEITSSTGVPADVSKAAFAHPLTRKDPLYPCSQRMHASVYGTGANHRNAVLTELPKLTDAYNKSVDTNAKVQADPNATATQKQAAFNDTQQAYKAYLHDYNQYRSLPEEADAWHTGDSVGKLLGH